MSRRVRLRETRVDFSNLQQSPIEILYCLYIRALKYQPGTVSDLTLDEAFYFVDTRSMLLGRPPLSSASIHSQMISFSALTSLVFLICQSAASQCAVTITDISAYTPSSSASVSVSTATSIGNVVKYSSASYSSSMSTPTAVTSNTSPVSCATSNAECVSYSNATISTSGVSVPIFSTTAVSSYYSHSVKTTSKKSKSTPVTRTDPILHYTTIHTTSKHSTTVSTLPSQGKVIRTTILVPPVTTITPKPSSTSKTLTTSTTSKPSTTISSKSSQAKVASTVSPISSVTKTTTKPPSPTVTSKPACSSISVRQEWRELTKAEQNTYVKAVQCLRTAPSVLRQGGAMTVWEDFVYVHSTAMDEIHGTAQFLPWVIVYLTLAPLVHGCLL